MGTPELGSTKAASNPASDSQRTNRSTANFAYLREVVFDATDRIASRPSIRTWLAATIFRSFGGTFLFTLFFAVFSYFAVVTIVNPRGVFWGQAFPEIMPNSRMLKLDLLQQYNRTGKVELVVLGSSRSTRLSPDLVQSLTGERTFNAGVFSGAPNDYLSIYRVMKQQEIMPKTLLVGLDQEALDPETGPAPDFESNLALTSALGGTVPNLPAKMWHWVRLYKQTLTTYYIQNIGQSVWIRLHPRPPLFEFESNGHEEDQVIDAQIQSRRYPRLEKIEICEDSLETKFSTYRGASPELERDLTELFSEAAADHVRVLLWITPVHPEALEKILNDPVAGRNFRDSEAHLMALGARYHLPVRDLTDSRSFGGHPDSWYDCVHYSQADSDRIAKELLQHGL
jgi:hypothetical protein